MNSGNAVVDEALVHRAYSEFLEMPGLRLTCQQARRLWGLDEWTCLHVLESLVDAKLLCRTGTGMYMRLTEGPIPCPPPRMAKAQIDTYRPRMQAADSVRRTNEVVTPGRRR